MTGFKNLLLAFTVLSASTHNGIKLRQEDLMGRYDRSCHNQSPC